MGDLPLGVKLLAAFAALSVGLFALAAFGPDLPGPGVGELVGDEEEPWVPCDPAEAEIREPGEPVQVQGRWRGDAPLPVARDELRGVAVGSRIYILNGHQASDSGGLESVSEVDVYDAAAERYSRAPDTPIPLDHSAVVAYKGDVYLVGGDSNGQSSAGLWRYSPGEEAWQELPSMPTPRGGHAAEVIGDRLYVFGGTTESAFTDQDLVPLTSLDIFDFRTGEWSSGPDMPTGRHHFDSAVLAGQLYAIGGRTAGDYSMDAVEVYDPDSNQWEQLAPLPLGTSGQTVEAATGRVVVVAGSDDLEGWVTPATWAYDPRRDEWRRLADLSVPRHGHTSAVIGDKVYVFGGAPCAGFGRTASVESLAVVRGGAD
jgi:N-acetylneuraminic acid mutarotase